MIYGVNRGNDPPNGIRFDVRSDLGDARAFDLAGEILIPYGVGTFTKVRCPRDRRRRIDAFDATPQQLQRLARQTASCS